MTDAQLLAMLKIDIGFRSSGNTAIDDRLIQLIQAAEKYIKDEGATTLDRSSIGDAQLIVMYAAWLWRRRDTQDDMPRMVRYAINNRVFAEKMEASGS